MEKRKWYDKDIITSLLGFGVMRVKTKDGVIDEKKGFELIDYAYNHGVNYFDTAMPYTDGQNETFLGKALKKYPRDSFYIATKLSLGIVNSKEEMFEVVDKQLQNLQTDHIDFYLLHAMSKNRFDTLIEWGVFEHLEGLKKQGKIRNIGFSFHDNYEAFKYILNYYPWDFCQIQLNYMDTENQQGIRGYYDAYEKKIPVVIMEPVKGGKLASFYKPAEKLLKDYAPSSSIASWALRWVGSLPGIRVILSGMNEFDQVTDNINTFSPFVPLNNEETKLVDKVKDELSSIVNIPCTACRYCMPCTVGVNIPGNFRLLNDYMMYQNKDETLGNYKHYVKEKMNSELCVSCNKCVKQCPQQINIPEELKKVSEKMKEISN